MLQAEQQQQCPLLASCTHPQSSFPSAGATHPWKGPQQYPNHAPHPSLLHHLPPHLQAQLFDPSAAAAAAMAGTLQQQLQPSSGGLNLASLAALQQIYSIQQQPPPPLYGGGYMMHPNPPPMLPQG